MGQEGTVETTTYLWESYKLNTHPCSALCFTQLSRVCVKSFHSLNCKHYLFNMLFMATWPLAPKHTWRSCWGMWCRSEFGASLWITLWTSIDFIYYHQNYIFFFVYSCYYAFYDLQNIMVPEWGKSETVRVPSNIMMSGTKCTKNVFDVYSHEKAVPGSSSAHCVHFGNTQ